MVGLYYIGDAPFEIQHGDRIAQAVIADVKRYATVEVDTLSDSTRGAGGFGSTGLK
jgi:dUTP pyrophosphatase